VLVWKQLIFIIPPATGDYVENEARADWYSIGREQQNPGHLHDANAGLFDSAFSYFLEFFVWIYLIIYWCYKRKEHITFEFVC